MRPLLDLDVYTARREAFLAGLDDAVVVLGAAPVSTRSHDVEYPYRPSSDLLYLTGFPEPEAIAVLRPGADEHPFVLFVRPRDPERETWNGRRAGVDGAVADYGADAAYPITELDEHLPELIAGRRNLYYAINQRPDLDRQLFAAMKSLAATRDKPNRSPIAIIDPRPRLHDQRRVKSAAEMTVVKKAVEIAVEAHRELMRTVRPGMMEYQLAAQLDYTFRRAGAAGPGYETIVGGGNNATILHYTDNCDRLEEGDLVLVDAGCEYHFYNSDLTRTFPVGATFSPAQRDLYDAVLEVQKEAIDRLGTQTSAHEMTTWSKRRMSRVMLELGLLEGDLDQIVEEETYKKFYMHGLGHYLGMDVHDVGTYLVAEDDPLPLAPGVLITVEPGIYIPEDAEDVPEEMRGVGIRIEDDVLITETGVEVLSAALEKEPDEIEALRREAFD
jgi:Xaa-Pro aminopeptidase